MSFPTRLFLTLGAASVLATLALAVDVGSGAPTPVITQIFIQAYYRGNFQTLTSLPPKADVKRLGAGGLVQEFNDANKTSGVTYAIAKASVINTPTEDGSSGTYQIYPSMYTYFNGLGVGTVGYPTVDTQSCPTFSDGNSCLYQTFDRNYALFVYASAMFSGTNFYIRNAAYPFLTKWNTLGGISVLGPPVDAETAVTATATVSTNATTQQYRNGVTYQVTSGPFGGKMFSVIGSIYQLYQGANTHAGYLGLPISDDFIVSGTFHKQNFQGGTVAYTEGSEPYLLLPVSGVTFSTSVSTIVKMNLGDTAQYSVKVYAANGAELADRVVTFTSSNGSVATVKGSGSTVTITAVGGGNASVYASSEGKLSPGLAIAVTAPCCAIGEGAPTSIVQQTFQDAVTRNRLEVQVPTPSPVRRLGAGYVQDLISTDPARPGRYLVCKPDNVSTAFVVTGDILARFERLSGASGVLGYPVADANGAHQVFIGGALGGSPVRLVSSPVLDKWAFLGFETGTAGAPTSEVGPFLSSSGTSGVVQSFQKGIVYGATNGAYNGQAFLVTGLILTRYSTLGGPSGSFGMPTSDEFVTAGTHRQNFEQGYFDYATGDAAAQEHATIKKPSISATPALAVAGSRVRLTVDGFPKPSTVRVSVAGQTDFQVTTTTGAYSWQIYIPTTATSGSVALHVQDLSGQNLADGFYTVRSFLEARLQINKLQGDSQTGAPGALLPKNLRVAITDASGTPVVGVPVTFTASPGAQVVSSSGISDVNGQAEASIRLPSREGVALINVDSPGVVASPATFSVLSSGLTLTNFPVLNQAIDGNLGNGTATIAQKGALLTAAAGIIRFHQMRGEMGAANGLADPASLNQFLAKLCLFDSQNNQLCDGFLSGSDTGEQVLNLWRLEQFIGGGIDVSVENPAMPVVRDLIAGGSPVLLALNLTSDGDAAGGHYLVAIGLGEDGSIVVRDPSPDRARTTLDEYLSGFTIGGHLWKATLGGAVRLLPAVPASTRFLLASVAQAKLPVLDAQSSSGACSRTLDLPDAAAATASRFIVCDGSQALYQVSVAAGKVGITDLASGGVFRDIASASAAIYRATRPSGPLVLGPIATAFTAANVVNAATFAPGIAPGGLFSIFGSGLSATSATTKVTVNGTNAPVLVATPFQINAQMPVTIAAGNVTLRVTTAYGFFEQTVAVKDMAPGIFVLSPPDGGAVTNQDNKVNTAFVPARRTQALVIYCTGLGVTAAQGALQAARNPVKVVLNGVEYAAAFAGLTPGTNGILYQVNVTVPATAAPGLDQSLLLRQAGGDSNVVKVSIQ